MFSGIISCIKGNYTLSASGNFPERILNIASVKGIYVYDVKRSGNNCIEFSTSRKGAHFLIDYAVEGITLTVLKKRGLPVFIRRYRKRAALFLLPVLVIILTAVFSLFIWRVNIYGGDDKLQGEIRRHLRENGVYVGALKHKVDHYDVKRNCIMGIDSLSWVWVDIKGTTAHVKLHERNEVPYLLEISEPADVIALHSGVIEKMQVYCGQPLFSEGMTVEKGQTLVTGVFRSENENIPTYYHHARADVTLRLTRTKSYVIPEKEIKKIPTGNIKKVFAVNFKKNNVKFSLNSGISYNDYDKIEKTVTIPFLPISFSTTEYREADVVYEDVDTDAVISAHQEKFIRELKKKKMTVLSVTQNKENLDGQTKVTFTAQCTVRTDKEIPVKKGETDGKNS